jgi:threonyl-tRNA synthetase
VILAVGGREEQANTVAVRRLGSTAQEVLPLEQIASQLIKDGAIPN